MSCPWYYYDAIKNLKLYCTISVGNHLTPHYHACGFGFVEGDPRVGCYHPDITKTGKRKK